MPAPVVRAAGDGEGHANPLLTHRLVIDLGRRANASCPRR